VLSRTGGVLQAQSSLCLFQHLQLTAWTKHVGPSPAGWEEKRQMGHAVPSHSGLGDSSAWLPFRAGGAERRGEASHLTSS
jgi:hypothetical protein